MSKLSRERIKTLKDNISNNPSKLIFIFLVSLFIISVTVLIILEYSSALGKDTFGREIGNTLLQIIAVSVVGTVVSLLLKENESVKQLNENKNQFRKDILRQLNQVYSSTKSTRRMLRAKAFKVPYKEAVKNDEAIIDLQLYDSSIENINTSQLKLEIIVQEIETNKSIFINYIIIKYGVSQMEKYLNKLVQEYENSRANLVNDFASLKNNKLTKLKKMLGDAKEPTNPFKANFIEPYKIAIAAGRKELFNETINLKNISHKSTDKNKALVKRFFDEACNDENLKAINEIFAEEVELNGKPGTPDDVIKYVQGIKNAFNNARVEINSQLAEEDRVSTLRTWLGIQIKDYLNYPATGKLMTWTELSVVRLEAGKIVEDWVVRSELEVVVDNL